MNIVHESPEGVKGGLTPCAEANAFLEALGAKEVVMWELRPTSRELDEPISPEEQLAQNKEVFYTVNELGDKRNDSGNRGHDLNVKKPRAVYADFDFKDSSEEKARALIETISVKPSAVVMSGGGLHVYWFVRDEEDEWVQGGRKWRLWRGIMRHLRFAYGADPVAQTKKQLLRLPGYWNLKAGRDPRKVTTEALDAGRVWTIEELAAGFGTGEEEDKDTPEKGRPSGTQWDAVPQIGIREAYDIIDEYSIGMLPAHDEKSDVDLMPAFLKGADKGYIEADGAHGIYGSICGAVMTEIWNTPGEDERVEKAKRIFAAVRTIFEKVPVRRLRGERFPTPVEIPNYFEWCWRSESGKREREHTLIAEATMVETGVTKWEAGVRKVSEYCYEVVLPLYTESGLIAFRMDDLENANGTVFSSVSAGIRMSGWPEGQEQAFPFPQQVQLTSVSDRRSLASLLSKVFDVKNLEVLLGHAAYLVAKAIEEEDKPTWLEECPTVDNDWLLFPFVFGDGASVIYGDGGLGKTLLVLQIANAIMREKAGFGGGMPKKCPNVLFVDYEANQTSADKRLKAMMEEGEPDLMKKLSYYNPNGRPLREIVRKLEKDIAEKDIGLMIVDSGMLACGGKAEVSEDALRMFAAVKRLKVPTLIICHVTKASDNLWPFGSVVWRNVPRVLWNMRWENQETGNKDRRGPVIMQMTKNNEGTIAPRIRAEIRQRGDGMIWEMLPEAAAGDGGDNEENRKKQAEALAEGRALVEFMDKALGPGEVYSLRALAEALLVSRNATKFTTALGLAMENGVLEPSGKSYRFVPKAEREERKRVASTPS